VEAGQYPVSVRVEPQESYARLLPLVKWLLLVPHYLALALIGAGVVLVGFLSFFATVATARYPERLWSLMLGFHRWSHRVWAYQMLVTDRYPPFTLAETPDDGVRVTARYPERVARWRPFLAWLLIVPYALLATVVALVAQLWAIAAFFSILFRGTVPDAAFRWIVSALNWQNRTSAYACWMSTRYPPFTLK
jgi:hypothetical protein